MATWELRSSNGSTLRTFRDVDEEHIREGCITLTRQIDQHYEVILAIPPGFQGYLVVVD